LVTDLFIRGLSIRVKELACVVMSALFDDLDPVVEIQARLTGQREEDAEASHG